MIFHSGKGIIQMRCPQIIFCIYLNVKKNILQFFLNKQTMKQQENTARYNKNMKLVWTTGLFLFSNNVAGTTFYMQSCLKETKEHSIQHVRDKPLKQLETDNPLKGNDFIFIFFLSFFFVFAPLVPCITYYTLRHTLHRLKYNQSFILSVNSR